MIHIGDGKDEGNIKSFVQRYENWEKVQQCAEKRKMLLYVLLFFNSCQAVNAVSIGKYYKQILKESTKTILSLKYYYNRPRPHQLAEYYGLNEFGVKIFASTLVPIFLILKLFQILILLEKYRLRFWILDKFSVILQ